MSATRPVACAFGVLSQQALAINWTDPDLVPCDSAPGNMFPNINYALGGYNIFYGNPLSDSVGIDPGFKNRPLFKADYSGCEKTADQKYPQPKGLYIRVENGCIASISSKVIETANAYEHECSSSMSMGASVDVPGKGGGSFGMSNSMKRAAKSDVNKKVKTIISRAECVVFGMTFAAGIPPEPADGFKNVVAGLTDENSWHRMFDDFGTHFMDDVKMGSRFGFSRLIDEAGANAVKSASDSSSFDLSGTATSEAQATVSGSFDTGSDSVEASVREFHKVVTESKTISLGKQLKGGDDNDSWLDRVIESPMPIQYTTHLICDHPIFDGEVKSNCQNALTSYCTYLKGKDADLDCDGTRKEPECKWDVDCYGDRPNSKFCRDSVCVDPPMCKVEMYTSNDFTGDRVTLEVTPECKGGEPFLYSGQEACLYDAHTFAYDMWDEIDSVRVTGACEKTILLDDDDSGDDVCMPYSGDNLIIDGEGSVSDMDGDIEEDVCKVIVVWKPLGLTGSSPEVVV